QSTGKFSEGGREYFDRTWGNAEAKVRQKVYQKACRRAGVQAAIGNNNGDGKHHTNGGNRTAHVHTAGDDGRPVIEVTPDEHIVNDQVLKALRKDETLFRR